MFKKNKIKIIEDLYLDKPLQKCDDWNLDFFDREGYQLNRIEKEFHAVNEVSIHTEDRMARRVSDDALNVVLQHWYTQIEDHPNIFIDHAHILHRFGFKGEALDQLINESNTHPKLNKMVHIKPKYGLDFGIDWIDDNKVVELFHIELDCRDYKKFCDIVKTLEMYISNLDWETSAKRFINEMPLWSKLGEYKQAEYKAKFWGLDTLGIEYFTDHYLNKPYWFTYLKVID